MAIVAIVMSLIHNERTKLRATALNGLAVAAIAAGFITPLAAFVFGYSGASTRGLLPAAGAALTFVGIGMGLHVLAMRTLGGLVE